MPLRKLENTVPGFDAAWFRLLLTELVVATNPPDELAPGPTLVPDVRLLAIAAKVSSKETAEAVSAVFIKLGSLILLFWNPELDAIFEFSFSDDLTGTSQ